MEMDGIRCSLIVRVLKKEKMVNDNIVLDVFIICQKVRQLKKKYRTRTYLYTFEVIP